MYKQTLKFLTFMMYLAFLLIVCSPSAILSIKNKKKTSKASTEAPETTTSQPAILAIEIVDPNENSTTAKNSKRTIESALGYGYNSYDTSKHRYEIYKYSQHDIPPYRSESNKHFEGSHRDVPVNIQKSVQYTLPTVTEQVPSTNKILSPGTTLYSSLSSKGQVGGLTSSLSQISGLEHNQAPVPVVVLRIYPDQLKDSTIQANLPASHPFAKTVNSINIQSLLLHYIKALQNPGYSGGQFGNTQTSQAYSPPAQSNDYSRYQTSTYYNQDTYQKPTDYQRGNQVDANYQYYQQSYPEESNYQQNQYQQEEYSDYNNGIQIQEAPVKYQFSYESTTAKQSSKKPQLAQQPQYYYVQPNTQSSHTAQPAQYYQPTQQLDYSKQPSVPPVQQYYTANDQQYQHYYQGTEGQQYVPTNQNLLTTENYPTSKHTRVVFRTKSGNIRTSKQEEAPTKEIKTIKIEVPENIAKVEVQETERPYYNYQQPYPEDQQGQTQYSKDSVPNNYYLGQDSVQQDYYSTGDNPADGNYNYQNIDYDQMAKYFTRRGAMPKYFFQEPEDTSRDSRTALSPEEMLAAYEEAAFPSTTKAPEKKKVKNKKRT